MWGWMDTLTRYLDDVADFYCLAVFEVLADPVAIPLIVEVGKVRH